VQPADAVFDSNNWLIDALRLNRPVRNSRHE